METTHDNFTEAIEDAVSTLLTYGEPVNTTSWQGKVDPKFNTLEITNFSFTCPIPSNLGILEREISPNLPWASDHFKERIGGEPLNPGAQYKNWPYYKEDRGMREVGGELFSHTYMERLWCPAKPGIRYAWGNLLNVKGLLTKDPLTRQAYLPIWFPEDTGAGGNVPRRVPCTLGYHFLCRNNRLHIFYDIRSCDVLRHFQDDIYFACRLLLWMLDELKGGENNFWKSIEPGTLIMHIYSLHCFQDDVPIIKYRRKHGKIV